MLSGLEFIRRTLFGLLLLACVTPLHAQTRFEYSEVGMGVRARIVLYAKDEPTAQSAARAAYDRIAHLEDIMSDYRPTSEISRLSAKAGDLSMIDVSPELFFILTKSQDLARRSDGAFDVTVGPLVKLWRIARKSGKLPSKEQLDAARRLVGWRKLHLSPLAPNTPNSVSNASTPLALSRDVSNASSPLALSRPDRDVSNGGQGTATLDTPGMQLDLGGIAKGYGCDEAIRTLKEHGIASALVEMGGDIVVSDAPPGAKGWQIEIENARHKIATLYNAAISSSGDVEQFVEIAGKRYSHIVDPRTGLGLTDRIAVTVIAPNGVSSDGLSTAISVLGATRGKTLANTYPGVRVYIQP